MFGYYGIPYGIFTWEKPWFLRLCGFKKRDIDTLFSSVPSSRIFLLKYLPYQSEQTVCIHKSVTRQDGLGCRLGRCFCALRRGLHWRPAPWNLIKNLPAVSCAGARRLSSAFGRRRSPGSSAGSLPSVRSTTCRFCISFDDLAAWSRQTAPYLPEGLHFWNSCSRSRTGWCTAHRNVPRRHPAKGNYHPHSCSRVFWWGRWSSLTALVWLEWLWFSPPLCVSWNLIVLSFSPNAVPAPESHRSVAVLASFGRSWHSHIPFGLLFNFQGTMKRSFTYSHWVNSNSNPKRKNICELKKLFTHLDKGCRNVHPFSGSLRKTFWENLSPHLFGITKPTDTLFHRKNEKIFFIRLQDCLFSLAKNVPSLIWNWKAETHPVFRKKGKKICPPT